MRPLPIVWSLLSLALIAGVSAGGPAAFAAHTAQTAKPRAPAPKRSAKPGATVTDARRTPAPVAAADTNLTRLTGDWTGRLMVGSSALPVVVHLRPRSQGLTGTVDSPNQGVTGMAIDTVLVNGAELRFELRSIRAVYQGTVAPDATSIRGTWSQGAQVVMLDLQRQAALEQRRPQTPAKPWPYDAEEVVVENPAAGVKLAGTFTKPPGSGPFPAVLLIGGSGAQNRDEEIFEHRPFLVLADHLTRHGIAALRLDDRGVGGSTGSLALVTLDDFAADAAAAVRFLAARPDVDHARIGLVGHSEGGLVAPLVAAVDTSVAFVVLLAAPGIPGDSLLMLQGAAIMGVMNQPADMIGWNRRLQRVMFDQVKTASDSASLHQRLSRVISVALPLLPESRQGQVNAQNLAGQVNMMTTRWFRSFVSCDPAPTLRKLRCPVLALTGEKDLQVLPEENLAGIEQALAEGGNREHRTVELPGLNHLFQTAMTGSPGEYGVIEETFAPAALDTITTWIEARAGKR
jgi:hypothetical protein